jgi:hypothetical protein
MGKQLSRQNELSLIRYFPAHPGNRAVFLVEARTRKEMRQIRELFDMVGQLAEVTPISHGAVMSYAVQVQGETSLFGKIEWLLKTQFSFSLVERNFSEVTFHLVRSLCSESETEMEELPECGICASVDPFPTRATLEFASGAEEHSTYCSRCATRFAEPDAEAFIRTLVSRDRRRFVVNRETPVDLMPETVSDRPAWDADVLAIAG